MSDNKKAKAPAAPTPKPPVSTPVPSAPAAADLPKDKPEESYETGGLSEFKKPDHVITRVVEKVEAEIKEKIKDLTKESPEKLEITGYRLNIVLGYMYFAKIQIKGNSFIQAKILESPQGDVTLQSVTETKTDEDEREYFKLPKKPVK